MKKTFAIIAFLGICEAIAQPKVTPPEDRARQILAEVENKFSSAKALQADFTYEFRNEVNKTKDEAKGTFVMKKNKFKLKLANQEIYNNGKTVWTYLKDANEVSISDYTPDDDSFVTPEKVIKLYKKDYKYVFIREFTENGKVYEEIDLQPTDRSKKVFKIRLVVNKKTRSIKSWEIFEKNQNRSKYIINTIAYDVQVDDNYFNFDKRKYPNVNEVDLRD
ncbi:LolA family protein [Raineya orbicola]|uniref:Outer membrane lipoprotein carrier protein LolA n=1 Tax=Raineya orbicola TaxID=2016530 RepID=A0A2N3IEY2_9BACT|nr:outer membrane lipoprotein carrier protein LolA [Raineya orbicola]PKQ68871.1 Outer membrane lipoprotein carrier protein LolA [Raineya orbicola]